MGPLNHLRRRQREKGSGWIHSVPLSKNREAKIVTPSREIDSGFTLFSISDSNTMEPGERDDKWRGLEMLLK